MLSAFVFKVLSPPILAVKEILTQKITPSRLHKLKTRSIFALQSSVMKKLLPVFAILLLFASCQTSVAVAPPEYLAEPAPQVKREPSYISLPVSISYETVKKAIDKSVGKNLYNDDSYDNNNQDGVKVRVIKTGDIKIAGYKEYIQLSVPVHVFFAGQYIACDFCPAIEKSTDFEMEATFVSKIRVDQSWKLITETESRGFVIKKDPYMSLGPLNINIRSVVEMALKKQLGEITKSLDKAVKEELDIRKYVDEAWMELQKPILADSAYNAWLYFSPQEFIMAPLNCQKDKLTINGALLTFIDTKLGSKPIPSVSKMNGLTIKESIPQQFRIELPVEIDFEEATRQARLAFKDSTFILTKKKKVTIDDIEVYGRAGEIFIKTRLSGSVRATIYLKGKPAYDAATQDIYFQNLDYEVNTKQAMLKAASWLLKSTLKRKMETAFRYNLKEDMEAAKGSIKSYLDGYKYDDMLEVKGTLGSLALKGVSADDKAIKAIFYADGKAAVKILDLKL